jgi:hypothetical protein
MDPFWYIITAVLKPAYPMDELQESCVEGTSLLVFYSY